VWTRVPGAMNVWMKGESSPAGHPRPSGRSAWIRGTKRNRPSRWPNWNAQAGLLPGDFSALRSLYEFENLSPSTHVTFTFELERLEPRLRPFEKLIRIALQDGAKRTVRKLKLLIEKEMLANG